MQESAYVAHGDMEDRHWWFVGRRGVLEPLVDTLMTPAWGKVVDIGCGTGGTIAHLTPRYDCIGIEPSEVAVGIAREKYPQSNFLQGDVLARLPETSADAQLYLLLDVLEHIDDDRGFLREVVQLARPDARILITVPAHRHLWSPHDDTVEHKRRYEREELRGTWQGLPVRERLCTFFNARLYPVVRAIRTVNAMRRQASGEGGTDFKIPNPLLNRMLAAILAGERHRVSRALDAPDNVGYGNGVSLVAVLQKLPR